MNPADLAKRLVKHLLSPVADFTGYYDRRISRLLDGEQRLLVLMYHRIVTDPAEDPFSLGMCVTRTRFERQLAYLQREFSIIGLEDAIERSDRGEPLPRRAVALTFDDGYQDNLTVAAPILSRFGAPATFYVVTGGLDEGEPLWWDRVIATVARTRQAMLETATLDVPGLPERLSMSPLRRAASLQALLAALWTLPPEALCRAVNRLAGLLQPADDAAALRAPRMTRLEILKLAAAGFAIGGHTVRHADPNLLTREALRDELAESKRVLEAICQSPITSFAYPNGRMTPDMPTLVAEAGFTNAVSTLRGVNRLPLRRLALSRIGMPDAPVCDFKRAIRNIPAIGE